jgi:hypothetical protein
MKSLFIILFVVFAFTVVDARRHHHHSRNSTNNCSPKSSKTGVKTSTGPVLGTTGTTTTTTTTQPTASVCVSNGFLTGVSGQCSGMNGSDCCVDGEQYPTFACSPPITANTAAMLTVNGFQAGEDGGGAAACDGLYHSDSELIVALSTGWFDNKSRCGKSIKIMGNGNTVTAKVVDECDSQQGCDSDHAFQLPCANNIVDASPAVWTALGISTNDPNYGWIAVTWTDA